MYRKIGRLGAFENPARIGAGEAIIVRETGRERRPKYLPAARDPGLKHLEDRVSPLTIAPRAAVPHVPRVGPPVAQNLT